MKERKEKKEGRNGEVAPIGVSSCPALGLRSRRALSSGQERQVYHEKAEAITKVCYDSQYRATWLSLNPDSNSSGGPHYGEHCNTSKRPETAADLLYDRVLPFYASHGLTVQNILTDNGTEFKGRPMIHLYEILLDLHDIRHRYTRVATPRTNGFVERFNRTVLDEFFRTAFRQKLYPSVEELQKDLDKWLEYYNHERPHRGYRNMGRRPVETFELAKTQLKLKEENNATIQT